ncbi:anion permease [Virgibacillus phasianinus]|uniref:Phosphate transporter n=1 Tax=Virgibacillus phasianinus TaxID=2017483 RepID=A0A220U348_9BACI|nr:inorganic phosphate transporter [Virgibacillus phasianinus]ASK62173.1 anion permease [Virgibacillus phasianinus]
MTWTIMAFLVAYFFAFNIGASGSAAAMSVPYGSGAVKRRSTALMLCAGGILAGAVIGSGEVVETLSKSLVPPAVLTTQVVVIILMAAAGTLFITNLLGIPLSTSEVTVGAIVGAGLSLQMLNLQTLSVIIAFWFAVPVVACLCTYLFSKGGDFLTKKRNKPLSPKLTKIAAPILIAAGCLEAFAAGMNNVGNAVGPLVGAGIVSAHSGVVTGGICMALGVIFLGGKIIETGGKRIAKLSIWQGITVSCVSGLLVTFASIVGVPVPITQVTTSAIVGSGAAKQGAKVWRQPLIRTIVSIWVISPLLSMVVSYCLVEIVVRSNFYTVSIIAGAIFATLGIAGLASSISKTGLVKNSQRKLLPKKIRRT